jgi:hypothetical protein
MRCDTLVIRHRTYQLLILVVTALGLLSGGAIARAAGPTNTSPPTISGVAQQGATLTEVNGTWTPPPTGFTYRWELCNNTCLPIAAATGQTYVVQAGDVGGTVEVKETATDADGSATATSAPTASVTGNTSPPVISGTAQQGQPLTVSAGTWNENPPPLLTEQWQDCDPSGANCVAISGATATTYVPSVTDVGHRINVVETAVNALSTATVSSVPTAVVLPAPPAPTSAPSISGSFVQGSVLTVNHGGWTNSPTGLTDVWLRCDSAGANCLDIAGAEGQTYALTTADVGATLVVLETATNAGGSGTAFSSTTPVITASAPVIPIPVNAAPPTISGSTLQGQTLSEIHGSWSNAPTSFSYQWSRCRSDGCLPVPGATDQTYVLTAADVGATIMVLESAQNSGGSSPPSASASSAMVTAASSTAVAFSPSASTTDETVILIASISSSSANADPDGAITFYAGQLPIGGCAAEAVTPSGQTVTAFCQTTFPAGVQLISARYTPAAGAAIQGSSSAPVTLDVAKDATSTSLAVTPRVRVAKRATYTATVVLPASNSGPLVPTGTLRFYDGARAIRRCRSQSLTHLSASCTVRYRGLGRHRISARYSGDANFAGSASPTRAVRVVKASSGPAVLGFISSTLQWQFAYHPAFTHVSLLKAFGITGSTTVSLACSGPGCPFSKLQRRGGSRTSIDLRPSFHNRHLGAGAEITVRITRPHWIGKFYSFAIRPGRPPLIALTCLGVGAQQPGTGC